MCCYFSRFIRNLALMKSCVCLVDLRVHLDLWLPARYGNLIIWWGAVQYVGWSGVG